MLHLHWRLLPIHDISPTIGPSYIESGDSQGRFLLNVRTLQRTPIVAPNCQQSASSGPFGFTGLDVFGGPWLMTPCPNNQIDLYNLSGHYWKSVTAQPGYPAAASSQPCRELGDPACDPAVGQYWMRFALDDPNCEAHCDPPVPYLQNIQTGQTKADPNHTGGRLYEDLNSPSGTSRLCSPLRYSDGIRVLGSFALTPSRNDYRLRRCHSRLAIRVPADSTGSDQVVVSDQPRPAPVTGLDGLFLPSLQRFKIPSIPKGSGLAAVEGRTIYVQRDYPAPVDLYSATLPSRLPRH